MEDSNGGNYGYARTISEVGRLLPSSSQWNSIELDHFNVFPQATNGFSSAASRYSKSINFYLSISDRKHFRNCVIASVSSLVGMIVIILVLSVLSHKKDHHSSPVDLSAAVSRALLFFDAQKSGHYPKENGIKFRGDSGLQDGSTGNTTQADLVGGFYDSGNNMKFSFPTAYTVTLLSWTVIEYHDKYADINELDHVKDIIRWGSKYLLKLFVPSNSSDSAILYSQVGAPGNDTDGNNRDKENDISCWQRPEDMRYPRPVSICDASASDLVGELVAAMSAASLVFSDQEKYFSQKLVQAAEELFNLALKVDPSRRRTYTSIDGCGGRARQFYNSSGYKDELVWGATWLFFATGNNSYLDFATAQFELAEAEEVSSEVGVFSWDNKLTAAAILLTRLRYFHDLGYPYESTFRSATNRTDLLMCSYTSNKKFTSTKGGLILLKPDVSGPIQYAVTASFLTKLYTDYLDLLRKSGSNCGQAAFSLKTLKDFSLSQVHYIVGNNPMKMSYLVGYGDRFPIHVHHRAASIPSDGKWHSCGEGDNWLNTKVQNPNTLLGAMVAGPDKNDNFMDDRGKKWFTEPSIWGNAGLIAALIALHDSPTHFSNVGRIIQGIDRNGLFVNIKVVPPSTKLIML